jgi:putative phosphoribosyl transferase
MPARTPYAEGVRLAHAIDAMRQERPFVLGIPRRGVLVADAVARALSAPLDVLIAAKAFTDHGVPIAAIAEGGAVAFDGDALIRLDLASDDVERRLHAARARLDRMIERIRGTWPLPDLADRTVILVDDAIIGGLTMRAAIEAVRARRPRRLVVATPMCSHEASLELGAGVPELIHLAALPRDDAAALHAATSRAPLGDADIHDLIVRELRDLGADPFEGLAIDGVA